MLTVLRSPARLLRAALVSLAVVAALPVVRATYRIENIDRPGEMRGGITAVTFSPSGTLVVATRYGEIWMRNAAGEWHRFARGLDEPMGVIADSDRVIYVAHRPELLRISDKDGDGIGETYDVIASGWGQSHNYHEFFYGLKRDKAGNFYGALGLDSGDETAAPRQDLRGEYNPVSVLEPTGHRSNMAYRGWAIKITPDGKWTPFADGFRQPNGIGMSPDGDLFYDDNQGDYKPSCGLLNVEPGDFHGHVSSLKWETGYDIRSFTTEQAWRRYKSPAVVFPHGPIGVSGGEPVWDTTGGRFGPFAGQVFTGDFTKLVSRSSLEKVGGGWQGVCFPFLGRNEAPGVVGGEHLTAGAIRGVFAPDGSLYLGATGGWGGGADGLQRVSWDGRPPAEMRDVKITERGFRITFTEAMSAATLRAGANFQVTRFRYYYHAKYGSPWVDEAKVAVKEVLLTDDGHGAELVLEQLAPGFVYEISVPDLRTSKGQALDNPVAYYTANRLLNGEGPVGGTTRLPRPDEKDQGAKDAGDSATTPEAQVAAGEKVYKLYCVACHQANGHGVPGGAANFVEDKTRLAKSDEDLLKTIAGGNETKGMPAFGVVLTTGQRKSVLAYIRATFGEKKAGAAGGAGSSASAGAGASASDPDVGSQGGGRGP